MIYDVVSTPPAKPQLIPSLITQRDAPAPAPHQRVNPVISLRRVLGLRAPQGPGPHSWNALLMFQPVNQSHRNDVTDLLANVNSGGNTLSVTGPRLKERKEKSLGRRLFWGEFEGGKIEQKAAINLIQ